jgi:hypothetical protein
MQMHENSFLDKQHRDGGERSVIDTVTDDQTALAAELDRLASEHARLAALGFQSWCASSVGSAMRLMISATAGF